MKPYNNFATVYDLMQYDIDYEFWHEKLLEIIQNNAPGSSEVLELACGTGTLAIAMAKSGMHTEGVDISLEMLAMANTKAKSEGVRIKFYEQDIKELETHKTYDIIFCMCDGMNYILTDEDMAKTLHAVRKHLNNNGLFIFDLSSEYKLSEIIGNATFAETFEDSAYIWENEYEESTKLLNFLLTLFKHENDQYKRFEEYHQQRAYAIDEMKEFLKDEYALIEIVDGDTFETIKTDSERICFVMRAK